MTSFIPCYSWKAEGARRLWAYCVTWHSRGPERGSKATGCGFQWRISVPLVHTCVAGIVPEIMSIWGPIFSRPKIFASTIGPEADNENQTAQPRDRVRPTKVTPGASVVRL